MDYSETHSLLVFTEITGTNKSEKHEYWKIKMDFHR